MVRKAWTLLDRAYTQCRRAMTYWRYVQGDYESLLPSLRRNAGTKGLRAAVKQVEAESPATDAIPAEAQQAPPA